MGNYSQIHNVLILLALVVYIYIYINIYTLAEYPRYTRFIQLAPAEGYPGAHGPFSLLACGQKKYPRYARVIKLAPTEGYSGFFGPFSFLGVLKGGLGAK